MKYYVYSRIGTDHKGNTLTHLHTHTHTMQYNTIIILSDVLYNYIGNAMLINNNYVIIMFIDCPGASTRYFRRVQRVVVSYTVRG